MMFLPTKDSNVSRRSSIGTLFDFFLTMLQLFPMQRSKIQGEHWIKTANSRHMLHPADSNGRSSLFKKHYRQLMPQPRQSHHSVCGFYQINAAFYLFTVRQEESTEVHDVILFSILSSYMYYCNLFKFYVQVLNWFL